MKKKRLCVKCGAELEFYESDLCLKCEMAENNVVQRRPKP